MTTRTPPLLRVNGHYFRFLTPVFFTDRGTLTKKRIFFLNVMLYAATSKIRENGKQLLLWDVYGAFTSLGGIYGAPIRNKGTPTSRRARRGEGATRLAPAVDPHSRSVFKASIIDFLLLLQGVWRRRWTVSWHLRYSSNRPLSTHTDWRHFLSQPSIHLGWGEAEGMRKRCYDREWVSKGRK